MRLVSLPCAMSCLALAGATLGCAVPDVQFYADDAAAKDGAARDAPADAVGTDGPMDGPMDGPTDGPTEAGAWSCPGVTPAGFNTCCGLIPCSGVQCSNMMVCNKCQQCPPDPGVVCCVKMNTPECHNVLDAGPCP